MLTSRPGGLETSHPPTIYVTPADMPRGLLVKSRARMTWCEYKGAAVYLDALVGGRRIEAVAWTYPNPSPGYEVLRHHVAFYAQRVDAAWLDDELVGAQEGGFHGGWITRDLVGPFSPTTGRGTPRSGSPARRR
ncbi:MAG TPA: DUF427 domain-containing protein [Solirubrobacteraceae bacterium]|nr:DUF427 domain-containing protein [Solirubrobacteraceae bacterium]